MFDIIDKDDIKNGRGLNRATVDLITDINDVLDKYDRMTVRQVFYQMAVRHIVGLSDSGYTQVQHAIKEGRKRGFIRWDKIADRHRIPYQISMWNSVESFKGEIVTTYRKDVWQSQNVYLEVWFEKMALYDIFSNILSKYGIMIQPTVGYASVTIIHDAVTDRFSKYKDRKCGILYFGDHDPSGVDIDRAIIDELQDKHIIGMMNGNTISFERKALNYEDIEKYDILPNIDKVTDKRLVTYKKAGFEMQAEIDALPPDILEQRIKSVLDLLNAETFNKCIDIESEEKTELRCSLGLI